MSPTQERRASARGFTLIELLVTISIIALLIALLLPALRKARDVANTAQCASQVRQSSLAANVYSNDEGSWLPRLSRAAGANPYARGRLMQELNYYYGSDGVRNLLQRCPSSPLYVSPTANPNNMGTRGSYAYRWELGPTSSPPESYYWARNDDTRRALFFDLYWYDNNYHGVAVNGAGFVSGGINTAWADGSAGFQDGQTIGLTVQLSGDKAKGDQPTRIDRQ